jgi:chromosomal replication initiation ATPase DnaA
LPPSQLVFDLPHIPALGSEDFLVSASNEQAVKLIAAWPDWVNPITIMTGPEGSGKTHLANVWRARSGAAAFGASDVPRAVERAIGEGGPVVIEDFGGALVDEHAAFHLLNLAKEKRFDLLITGRTPPGEWRVSLPDLRSRLRSAALVTIEEPDEALIGAVIVKLFADRQLGVEPGVVGYLLRRMERSMAAAQRLVEAIDRAALAERRRVTRALAARLFADETPVDRPEGNAAGDIVASPSAGIRKGT